MKLNYKQVEALMDAEATKMMQVLLAHGKTAQQYDIARGALTVISKLAKEFEAMLRDPDKDH